MLYFLKFKGIEGQDIYIAPRKVTAIEQVTYTDKPYSHIYLGGSKASIIVEGLPLKVKEKLLK